MTANRKWTSSEILLHAETGRRPEDSLTRRPLCLCDMCRELEREEIAAADVPDVSDMEAFFEGAREAVQL